MTGDTHSTLTAASEALVRKHERGDYREEGWTPDDDGLECRPCGDWCDMPARLAAIEAEAAQRERERWTVERLAKALNLVDYRMVDRWVAGDEPPDDFARDILAAMEADRG